MTIFHAKGLVYLGAWEFYEQTVPGGSQAVGAALTPSLRGALQPPFIASSWFDALPIHEVSRVAAELAGLSHRELVRRNARWLAHRDVNGVYRALLKLATPSMVAVRLPRLSLRYFDFGEAEGTMTSPCLLSAMQRGVPRALASWMVWAVEGFAPVALELAGARDVRVASKGDLVGDGNRGGHETVSLKFTIGWR